MAIAWSFEIFVQLLLAFNIQIMKNMSLIYLKITDEKRGGVKDMQLLVIRIQVQVIYLQNNRKGSKCLRIIYHTISILFHHFQSANSIQ